MQKNSYFKKIMKAKNSKDVKYGMADESETVSKTPATNQESKSVSRFADHKWFDEAAEQKKVNNKSRFAGRKWFAGTA